MKKIFSILLVITVLLVVTGCSKEDFEVTNNGVTTRVEEKIKKTIRNVDEKSGNYVLLGIDEIKLAKSGNLYIETDDILEHLGDDILIAANVQDVYLLPFGNAGYRTIIFIRYDKTVSAVNTTELVTNKNIEILDNLGNYNDVKSVESENNLIYITLENGKKYQLDEYLK